MAIRVHTIVIGTNRTGPQGPRGPAGDAVPHNDLDGRDVSAAHPASVITYDPGASGLAATDAQAAIDEIAAGKASTSHASTHLPGGSDAIGPAAPITESGTTRTLSASDHGRTILYTHASGCAVTVPHDLDPGHTVEHVALGGAAVTVAGSGGLTVRPSPGCDAEIIDGGTAYTRVESATAAALVGELTESE